MKLQAVRMTRDRVLVIPDFLATETEGGLEIVRTFQERPSTGTVMAVGPGVRTALGEHVTMTIEEGDRVIFDPNIATRITLDKQEVYVFDEEDIICVLHDGQVEVDIPDPTKVAV